LEINRDGVRRSAYDLLAHPGVDMAWLAKVNAAFAAIDARTAETLEIEAKYAVYLDRQKSDAELMRHEEGRIIPDTLDFSNVAGLSNELRQKMRDRRPRTVAEAQRMEGMTPAALALVLAHVRHAEAGWAETRVGAA
jgi:tRNA uridine 5-carboxymethylaminomethyl modification enzyme